MAILKIHDGTSFVTAIGKVHDGVAFSGKMHFHDGVAFVPLLAPLSLNVTPASINEFSVTCPHTSPLLTANESGGQGPFTYAWSFTSGGAGITINSPTSKTTTLTQTATGFRTGTLQCIVTDANTDTASDTSSITMECGTL